MAKDKYEGLYLAPSPEIGEVVQWFPHGNQETPRAAVVTAVDSPGNIQLNAFLPGQGFPKPFSGVLHAGNPVHKEGNMQTRENGSWDFVPAKPDRLVRAKEVLDRRLKAQEDAEITRLMHEEKRQQLAEKKELVGSK